VGTVTLRATSWANTFAGHITGAFVLSAISAAGRDWHTCFLRLAGIVCFLNGVFVAAILEHYLAKSFSKHILITVMAMEIVLVVLGYLWSNIGVVQGRNATSARNRTNGLD
jgi:uncharacterized membrane protein YoaK (UPF0700 family)